VTTIQPVELPKPDYAFIYAKLARHVATADALLGSNRAYEAGEELIAAMRAIEVFEATFTTAYFTIKTDDD
jgi:hypothetical protein